MNSSRKYFTNILIQALHQILGLVKGTYKKWHEENHADTGKKNIKFPDAFTPDALEVQIKDFMRDFLHRRREGMLERLGINNERQYEAYRKAGGIELEVGKIRTIYII